MGYLCANFSLPTPLCSRLRPDVRDRQTDVRCQTSDAHHRLTPPTRARAKNKALGEVKCLSERFSCRLRSVFHREGHSMRTVRQTKRAVATRSRGAAYFNSPQFLSRSKTTRRFNADSYDISDRDGDCSPHQIWLPRADRHGGYKISFSAGPLSGGALRI